MSILRTFFVAMALVMGMSGYASPGDGERKISTSFEIQEMLSDSKLILEEGTVITVLFQVTEDRTISIHYVGSRNKRVRDFLEQRLQGQKLIGKQWTAGEMYELPVRLDTI